MNNLFNELAEYFTEKYFSPDLSNIQNFDATDIQRFLPWLIVGLCVGTFIAICISHYNGHYLGQVVRALYKADAFSPEKAKTLEEISCNKYLIRRNLTRETVLAKYVKPCGEVNGQKEAAKASYYLLEEQKYIADKRFKETKHPKLTIFLSLFICIAACFFLLYTVPDILQLADNVTGMFLS